MEEPGRSLGVGHDWVSSLSLFTFMHWRRKWQPTPVFLPGESQGQGSLWAAVYGVAQSWTRLKWLSSSSSSSSSMACSPPGYSVHGISQVRILEWVAVSFSGDLPNPRIEPVSCIGRWVLYHQATWEAHTPWITYAFIPDLLVPGWNHSIYSHLNLTSLAPTYLHCIGFSQALLY